MFSCSNTGKLMYLGFDDTDIAGYSRGTGRCIRDFCASLDNRYALRCILRHQLPKLPDIPYTSNNSSACAVLWCEASLPLADLFGAAVDYLSKETPDGSDPGVCLAAQDAITDEHVSFSLACNGGKVTQKDAMKATTNVLLAGVGGTEDGIIGAAAAVGLTKYGWCGRFIELGAMRSLPSTVTVGELSKLGIRVVSVDRDPLVPLGNDVVTTDDWLRPSLLAGQPVLQVRSSGKGTWTTALSKKTSQKA